MFVGTRSERRRRRRRSGGINKALRGDRPPQSNRGATRTRIGGRTCVDEFVREKSRFDRVRRARVRRRSRASGNFLHEDVELIRGNGIERLSRTDNAPRRSGLAGAGLSSARALRGAPHARDFSPIRSPLGTSPERRAAATLTCRCRTCLQSRCLTVVAVAGC